jgi:insulysin
MKDYSNIRFQQPYQQVMYNCSLLLEHKSWHINDFVEVLPTLEACRLTTFFPWILSRIFLKCYIVGTQSLLQVFLFVIAIAFQIL